MKKKAKAASAKAPKGKPAPKKAAVAIEAVAAKPNLKAKKPEKLEKKGALKASSKKESSIVISTADMCREMSCEAIPTTGGYCRAHYIKNWRKIKRKELILKEGKLNRYIEELVAKYPDKYIETIRTDLSNNAEFSKVVNELDLEEGLDEFDVDGENVDSLIDSIKRDIDDDSDTY